MAEAALSGRVGSVEQQLAALEGPADRLQWLVEHRLLGPVDLLEQRGMVAGDLAALARSLRARKPVVSTAQLEEERRVFAGFAEAGLRALALKGCLLAYRAYPDPSERWRADLDVLVPADALDATRRLLGDLGYRPIHRTPGGTPIRQETWVRGDAGRRWFVDLHWDIRDHPLLRDVFPFEEQYEASRLLPGLSPGARGQGDVHALLNSAMHWYDDLYEHKQPLGWLLDNDLLWRVMSGEDRARAAALAVERGIAGLVGDVLARTRDAFDTPIPDAVIDRLMEAGRAQPATGLVAASRSRYRSLWFALRSEPGWRARIRRLRHALLPPASFLRERYPEGSRFGLPGLYVRRIWRRVKQ